MDIIYECKVGSKMHGLSTPQSDDDVRYITMPSLREIVSPFKSDQIKVRDGNGEDTESWSLNHFVKHLTKGNPTVYEVVHTPLYEPLPYAEKIRSLMPYCFDGKKILDAHIGYAEAQLKRYLRPAISDLTNYYMFKKLSGIWGEDRCKRVPKAIVAAYRVLAQGTQLLLTGSFEAIISNYSKDLHNKLMTIKQMDGALLGKDCINEHNDAIESEIKTLHNLFDSLPDCVKFKRADIDNIEKILYEIYEI